jgi:hypothetical protein
MQNPTRLFDPLRPLTRPEREAHLAAYLRFLREREGEIDARARTLSQREPRMRALEQDRLVWTGPLDREGFARCVAGERDQQVDLRTQWILAAAKANEGERYGVEIEVGRYLRRGRFPGVKKPELMLYVLMQESYHCRILLELCQSCGLTFESRDPASPTAPSSACSARCRDRCAGSPCWPARSSARPSSGCCTRTSGCSTSSPRCATAWAC